METILLITVIILLIIFIVLYKQCNQKKTGSIELELISNNIKIKGVIKMVGLKLAQKVTATLKPVDRLGNVAQVETGTVVFSSSDETIFTVEQSDSNELECTITSVGVGTAQFDYSADADLGDGVKTITGFSAVEVLPLEAVGFGIEFGEPIDV